MPPQTTNNLTGSCDQTIQNHCDSIANTFLVNCLLDGFKKPKLSVFTDPLAKKGQKWPTKLCSKRCKQSIFEITIVDCFYP